MNESNRTGKFLQDLIKLSADAQQLGFERFKDAGFVGDKSEERRFTSRNKCDCFIYGKTSGICFIEAKNRESSLTFKDITQLQDLKKLADKHANYNITQAIEGVLVLFRNTGKVWFIRPYQILQLEEATGKKSFNSNDVLTFKLGVEIPFYIPQGKRKPLLDLYHIR